MLGIAQEDTDAAKPQTKDKVAETTQVKLPVGNRVVDAVLDGVKVDEAKRDAYVNLIQTALMVDDAIALSQLLDEIKDDADLKVAIWSMLPSQDRSAIKKHEAERRAA
jgi:hypothetical protein